MHIHESYHSPHTPGGGLFFCPRVFHQNSRMRCLSIFQSPRWLAGSLGITTFRYVQRAPSKWWVSLAMHGHMLQQSLETRSIIHAIVDKYLRPVGDTDACNIVRLWPSWPCPVWSALEIFWIFAGSSCPQQVLHLHLPFAHLWAGEVSDAGSVLCSYITPFCLQSFSSHLQNDVEDTIHPRNLAPTHQICLLLLVFPLLPLLPIFLSLPLPILLLLFCFFLLLLLFLFPSY